MIFIGLLSFDFLFNQILSRLENSLHSPVIKRREKERYFSKDVLIAPVSRKPSKSPQARTKVLRVIIKNSLLKGTFIFSMP